jgi:flagellin
MEGFIMSSSTVIRTNVRSLNAHRNLNSVGSSQDKASQRLSSGKKINTAGDDAAGLAISTKMKAQIRGLDMAYKNSQDAVSLVQTAEGSLSEINNMVQRIRELTVQAASDTNTGGTESDRSKMADEVDQLLEEITNMAGRTEFNTKVLATGNYQIGSTATKGDGTAVDTTVKTVNIEDYESADGSKKFTGGNAISFDNGTSFFIRDNSDDSITKVGLSDLQAYLTGTGDKDDVTIITANDIQKTDDGFMYIDGGSNGKYYFESLTDDPTAIDDDTWDGYTDDDKKTYIKDNSSLTFQIGANNRSDDAANARQSITMNLANVTADSIFGAIQLSDDGSTATIKTATELISDVIRGDDSSADDIAEVLDIVDAGLDIVTAQRSKLGAVQNRLEYTASNLEVSSENLSTANSRIEDADMATEMTNLTSANVLQQAATSMLAQANSSTQTVLQLLQ